MFKKLIEARTVLFSTFNLGHINLLKCQKLKFINIEGFAIVKQLTEKNQTDLKH